ncbi:protein phosphatase 1 regulatory subunit 37 [Silurus meridionalis]|uniref:protein phosphatase 1 regulatory subunit 37 n=1 Tax=Silurus meridionalis TaxID=175797 RepID=UPI001EEAD9D3|nr:protein phosphatase 1 regulatory subunit 37 [Silurus meridionalis]
MTMSDHAEEEEVAHRLGGKSRREKRVSFPPDEEMVSGYAESKDARQDGDSRNLSDIISAYERSCAKHKVAPDPRTLDQIKTPQVSQQNITQSSTLPPQAHRLPFVHPGAIFSPGVRLDYRMCESLEEILKSVRFNLINLQGAELEENGASSLMDMISYYESATHLDVSSNTDMGVSGWQALSRLLIQSGCLWRLDACNIPIEDYPAQALSRALLSSRLTVLHLENTGLSGKPLFTLVIALFVLAAPHAKIISHFFLGVCSLKKNIALQELYLCDNELNSFHDAMQLGELLKYKRTLRTLDLTNNAISDSGLEELCDGLRVQKSGLRTLVLHNNRITHRAMTHLGSVLPLLRTLETLDLSDNDLQDRGMHVLKEALISNRSITRLGLASVGITCEGAVVLAEFLAESRFLQMLDVSQNLILTGGLMAFALALKLNRTLAHLDLDRNPNEEEDEFLIETQKDLLSRISDLCAANAEAASEMDRGSAALFNHDDCDGKDNSGEAVARRVPAQTLASA